MLCILYIRIYDTGLLLTSNQVKSLGTWLVRTHALVRAQTDTHTSTANIHKETRICCTNMYIYTT